MAEKGYTKLKLLYIKQYLERYSDEDNLVKADELIEMLAEKGITCERKSIYADISALKGYGVDISTENDSTQQDLESIYLIKLQNNSKSIGYSTL